MMYSNERALLDVRLYDRNGNLTSILGNDGTGNVLAISCLYDYRNRMVEYLDSEGKLELGTVTRFRRGK